VPTFCRHNRLVQNCPICAREQQVELRPVVSSATPKVAAPRPPREGSRGEAGAARVRAPRAMSGSGLRVRRLARGADDGYACRLVPGLHSSADAARLADEIAFAVRRLELLETEPPGLYATIAAGGDVEERTWLAFLSAYLSPLPGESPFAAIEAVATPWASGELPDLAEVALGPRTAHDPARGTATLKAYRAWAARAGSQERAFTGEPTWTAERRFDRVFERLALPGLHRDARYELLVTLGRLGVYELRGGALHLGGADRVTLAAKRALGIGDPMLLGRRAADLASACQVPTEALDVGFWNWEVGERAELGVSVEPDPAVVERCRAALGL
jgi:hypothetical protein